MSNDRIWDKKAIRRRVAGGPLLPDGAAPSEWQILAEVAVQNPIAERRILVGNRLRVSVSYSLGSAPNRTDAFRPKVVLCGEPRTTVLPRSPTDRRRLCDVGALLNWGAHSISKGEEGAVV